LENFCHKFANLVAPPTDGSTKRLVRCKVTDGGKSVKIDPQLATLSFIKLVKNDQKCGPEFGGLVWRHLTPERKTAI